MVKAYDVRMRMGPGRLSRCLINLAAGVSLLVMIVAIAGAVRSQFVSDRLIREWLKWNANGSYAASTVSFTSIRGTVVIGQRSIPQARWSAPAPDGTSWYYERGATPRDSFSFGRFAW